MAAVYVGRMYQIQIEGLDPQPVADCALGVDRDRAPAFGMSGVGRITPAIGFGSTTWRGPG
jgi:hypothetical protein